MYLLPGKSEFVSRGGKKLISNIIDGWLTHGARGVMFDGSMQTLRLFIHVYKVKPLPHNGEAESKNGNGPVADESVLRNESPPPNSPVNVIGNVKSEGLKGF